ncbi:MAG: hypothetical protein O2954_19805 [bacterium]|nr:hypothetical protein [bacterium]
MAVAEKGRRVCRACGERYEYPVHSGVATRYHCEQCVEIPKEIRRIFERMRRRLDRVVREVEALKRERDG